MVQDKDSKISSGLQRRKILEWVGIGLIGGFVIKAFPVRFVGKRLERKKPVKVSLNELAVKRNTKVVRNG